MDNRINELRKEIRLLRAAMLEAEAAMRDQIRHDRDCSEAALRLLVMRGVMSGLAYERGRLGDREPIGAELFFAPRRPYARKASVAGPSKRQVALAKKHVKERVRKRAR
jgi:hypothetical protein